MNYHFYTNGEHISGEIINIEKKLKKFYHIWSQPDPPLYDRLEIRCLIVNGSILLSCKISHLIL